VETNPRYIKVDRRNKDLYANLSVTWVPGNSDLDKEFQIFVKSLRRVYEPDIQMTPVFSEVKSTKFGSHSARRIDYIVANDGPRIGSYTTFHCDNITVIIGQHYTAESEALTNKCRQQMEDTYYCIGKMDEQK
jgi:hypothetical protein